MKIINSVLALVLSTVLLVTQVACVGPLGRLNDILPYAPSVVTVLVNRRIISPELGEKLKDDFRSGKTEKDQAESQLAALDKNDPQYKYKKYLIYVELGNDWRGIVTRNHFAEANNSVVNDIAGLITDILGILANRAARDAGVRSVSNIDISDKALDSKIDKLEKLINDNKE